MTPGFVITGTGRSGSGYISQVLRAAGIKCGHENWWNPWDEHDDTLAGDSSWCALALGLQDYDGLVFHQVRHPLDVVSSLVRIPPWGPYADLRARLVAPDDDVICHAMHTWLAYVEAAERLALRTWRLDDVDADLIIDLGIRIGISVDRSTADAAVASVPKNYNKHGEGHRHTWAELEEHDVEVADVVRAKAAQWEWT